MTNATQAQAQAGGVGAFPMAIASRPSEQQPSVAASVPINMRMPTTSRPRLGSRPNPPTDQSTAGRLDEADEVETDDERDDGPLNAGAGPASSGRPRRREEQRRLRKKARVFIHKHTNTLLHALFSLLIRLVFELRNEEHLAN